jgi:DNA-binding NarL/FixJ family response regulator
MKAGRPSNLRLRGTAVPVASPDEPWPQPPPGLELDVLDLDGEEIAVLHFPVGPRADLMGLSGAEADVATAIVNGMSNEEIARVRRTSPRTVAKQVASIFRKLAISSRRELVARVRSERRVR